MADVLVTDLLKAQDGPELFFGLVCPTGTETVHVCDALESALKRVDYEVEQISLSTLIDSITGGKAAGLFEDERVAHLMNAGTKLRTDSGRGDFVALLAVSAIRQIRAERWQREGINEAQAVSKPLKRVAYVLRSLKREEEVQTLRNIYGSAFSLISVYSSEAERLRSLTRRIAKSRHESDPEQFSDVAQKLINRDRDEGAKFGQDVRDTFPHADFFVKADSITDTKANIERFVWLLFGHPFITPTRDEYGMFIARSVAVRSADLGRQVGAAIATEAGDLISVGCNEVPKFGGGQYWEGDRPDVRDFRLGADSSAVSKRQALEELLSRLKKSGWLSQDAATRVPKDLVTDMISGAEREKFSGSQVFSVIEYGRSVHAEMAAITDAARRGVSITDATLYSTTFPCHLCARHIVSSGIKRVVYVEPYPKSRAEELYRDSISVNPDGAVPNRLRFEPFVGVAPSRYLQMFQMEGERKDKEGKVIDWENQKDKNPRIKRFVLSYVLIEENAGTVLDSLIDTLGLN